MVVGWRGTLYAWGEKFLPCDNYHRLPLKIEIERGESFKSGRSCITGKVQKELVKATEWATGSMRAMGMSYAANAMHLRAPSQAGLKLLCKRCRKRFKGQGYCFCLGDDVSPAIFIEENTSKHKTSGG